MSLSLRPWRLLAEALVNNFQGFPIQQGGGTNILVLACKVSEGFPDLEEANTQEVLNSC
jgi:hypothetical protein